MTEMKKIGQVAKELSLNVDTLRYYEKIQLLGVIKRTDTGIRLYSNNDVTRIVFIKEAQKAGFSLEEIRQLLSFRNNPKVSKPSVRSLVAKKYQVIEQRITELQALKKEFSRLTALCLESEGDCPILKKFECPTGSSTNKKD
ncbi:heavy metal-responsive transcriptional regulator [Eionea flava]